MNKMHSKKEKYKEGISGNLCIVELLCFREITYREGGEGANLAEVIGPKR